MDDIEPLLFFFFSDSESGFGVKADHSFLVGSPIGIVSIDGCSESFFGPMAFGNKVMVDKTTSSSRVEESLGVNNLT